MTAWLMLRALAAAYSIGVMVGWRRRVPPTPPLKAARRIMGGYVMGTDPQAWILFAAKRARTWFGRREGGIVPNGPHDEVFIARELDAAIQSYEAMRDKR